MSDPMYDVIIIGGGIAGGIIATQLGQSGPVSYTHLTLPTTSRV